MVASFPLGSAISSSFVSEVWVGFNGVIVGRVVGVELNFVGTGVIITVEGGELVVAGAQLTPIISPKIMVTRNLKPRIVGYISTVL